MSEIKKSIDVNFINAFWKGAYESMNVMGDIALKMDGVHIKPDNELNGDYYSVIGMSGGMKGSCAASFPHNALAFLLKELMGEMSEEADLLMDCAGEIVNLIAGGGKKHLSEIGKDFSISPPTSLANFDMENMKIFNPVGTVCVVITCSIEKEPSLNFSLEVALEPETLDAIKKRKETT